MFKILYSLIKAAFFVIRCEIFNWWQKLKITLKAHNKKPEVYKSTGVDKPHSRPAPPQLQPTIIPPPAKEAEAQTKVTCEAFTRNGKKCSFKPSEGSRFCKKHQPK